MNILEIFILACAQLALYALVYFLACYALKMTAHKRKDFWFLYRGIPRHIKRPDCKSSKYYDRFPYKNSWIYNYGPTIDDDFMIELAQSLERKIGKRSNKYKAGYILQLVQMGVTYRRDAVMYGDNEKHAFPVATSYFHMGDCEDSSYLGAGLSKLLGLDQVIILVYGHQAYGVAINGFGLKIEHNNKTYVWCESTSILGPGLTFNSAKFIGAYTVMNPPPTYLDDNSYWDSFEKYPL